MMGYAKQGQNTAGIHIRLYARAFIVEVRNFDVSMTQISCHSDAEIV